MAGGKWWQLAACRSADPGLFFPISSTGRSLEQAAEARAICARCPVRPHPLAFALRTRQVHGIWVGLSEEEHHPGGHDQPGTVGSGGEPAGRR
jgi:WhiB family redox-sensing transcriptional regulator